MSNRYYDALNNADAKTSAQASVAVIDRLQKYQPGEQIMGLAAAFLMLCQRFGVHAPEAFRAATNCIAHTNKRQVPEFRAVAQYIKEEL